MKNKLVYVLLITTIVSSILPSTVYAAPPSNDMFANAKQFFDLPGAPSIPYTDAINVLEATQEPAIDPAVNTTCGANPSLAPGYKSVWYKYTPTKSVSLLVDTFGSNYDTYIAVWTRPGTQFNLIACADDSQGFLQTLVGFSAFVGNTYYIEVAEINGGTGVTSLKSQSDVDAQAAYDLVVNVDYYQTIFADVPVSHPYFEYIEALYDAGLTGGCGTNPLIFCPSLVMNRAQMSVFTMRGEFGSGYTPPGPPYTPYTFQDNWANGMLNQGLTGGCATSPKRLYCPYDQTTKEQAAVFALRLKYGSSYTPPAATGTIFADMTNPTHWSAPWTERAYTDGLIPACGMSGGKPLFCPAALVDRGFGAYIIAKAKGLVP